LRSLRSRPLQPPRFLARPLHPLALSLLPQPPPSSPPR
jgi:hypothetical protein